MEEKKTLKEVIEEAGRADNFTCALCDAFDGNPCSISGAPKDDCCINVACLLIDAIDREFIERPKFEDGKFVKMGDKVLWNEETHVVKDIIPTLFFNDGYSLRTRLTVKRPEPKVVGADGKPIKVGETVYVVGYDRFEGPCEVTELKVGGFATVRWNDNSSGVVMASHLTHEQPDSLELIKWDALKLATNYWGCGDYGCDACPAKVDGMKPRERYGVIDCFRAQKLDLLRRQREVLERDER